MPRRYQPIPARPRGRRMPLPRHLPRPQKITSLNFLWSLQEIAVIDVMHYLNLKDRASLSVWATTDKTPQIQLLKFSRPLSRKSALTVPGFDRKGHQGCHTALEYRPYCPDPKPKPSFKPSATQTNRSRNSRDDPGIQLNPCRTLMLQHSFRVIF